MFYYVRSTGTSVTPIPIYAVAEAHRATISGTLMVSSTSYPQSEQVSLSDTLVVSDQSHTLSEQASFIDFINCSIRQRAGVTRVADHALTWATNASTYAMPFLPPRTVVVTHNMA
jgi:hypothetical protein